jgi:hypothetical protein
VHNVAEEFMLQCEDMGHRHGGVRVHLQGELTGRAAGARLKRDGAHGHGEQDLSSPPRKAKRSGIAAARKAAGARRRMGIVLSAFRQFSRAEEIGLSPGTLIPGLDPRPRRPLEA